MYNISDLDGFIRKFSCRDFLTNIGGLSLDLFNKEKAFDTYKVQHKEYYYNQTITQWSLLYLALRIILVSNDSRQKTPELLDICKSLSILSEINIDISPDEQGVFNYLLRTAQEQFIWQEQNFKYDFSRYKSIFNKNEYFADKFLSISGMTLDDYFLLSLSMFVYLFQYKKAPILNIQNFINTDFPIEKVNNLKKNKLSNFMSLVSENYSQIRIDYRDINKIEIPKYEVYEYNPLIKYPIVKIDFTTHGYEYVIPNFASLLDKMTKGIYWIIRESEIKGTGNEFLELFGKAFEDYCGDLLKIYFGNDNVKKLEDIFDISKNTEEIADWLVNLNGEVYLFECKSSLMPIVTKQTFFDSYLKKWTDRNFKKGIKQLKNSETLLLKSNSNIKNVNCFIITLERLFLTESPPLKEKMLSDLANEYSLENIYFIDIIEFERLEESIKKFTLKKILEKKNEIHNKNDLSQGFDFQYACNKLNNNVSFGNSYLDNISNETLKDIGISTS